MVLTTLILMIDQAAMALKEALLARDDVESVGGVVDHISMHNPCIQRSAVYPDLYAWGLLKDGRPFEAVGDSKFKVWPANFDN